MQEPILRLIELYESLVLVKRDYLDKDKISSNLYKVVELVTSKRGKKFENRESLYLTKILMNKYNKFNPPNPSDLIHALELIDRLRERRKIKGDLIADKNNPFNPDQPFPTLLSNLNKEFVVGKHVAKDPNERIDFKSLGLKEGKDYNLIYDRNNIQVLQLLTFDSTKIIKDVTNWCIQKKYYWKQYHDSGITVNVVVNYNFNEKDFRKYCAINLNYRGDIIEFENSQQTLHTDTSKFIEMPEYTKGQEEAALAYLKQWGITRNIFVVNNKVANNMFAVLNKLENSLKVNNIVYTDSLELIWESLTNSVNLDGVNLGYLKNGKLFIRNYSLIFEKGEVYNYHFWNQHSNRYRIFFKDCKLKNTEVFEGGINSDEFIVIENCKIKSDDDLEYLIIKNSTIDDRWVYRSTIIESEINNGKITIDLERDDLVAKCKINNSIIEFDYDPYLLSDTIKKVFALNELYKCKIKAPEEIKEDIIKYNKFNDTKFI